MDAFMKLDLREPVSPREAMRSHKAADTPTDSAISRSASGSYFHTGGI